MAYPSEKFSNITRQNYTLYKYMNKSIQDFYVNFHNVKMSNHVSSIHLNAIFRETIFYSHKFKSSVCLRKSIGLWQINKNKQTKTNSILQMY